MKNHFVLFYISITALYMLQCIKSGISDEISSSLGRPYKLQWKIQDDTVILSWEYPSGNQYPTGYYIHVQEAPMKGELGTPDFVHVKNGLLGTVLRGFKPKTRYLVKVVAFSELESKYSRAVYVDTKLLDFLKAYNLTATDITDTKAVFMWNHTPDNNVHDIMFKLSCNGVLQYEENGHKVKEEIHFEHLSHSSSQRHETYTTSSLFPNTLYTCVIQSVAGNLTSVPHSEIQFMTSPGKPPHPPKPRVIMRSSHDQPLTKFVVELYKSSNKFGPISHYMVFAVPVTRSPDEPRSTPFIPIVPYSQLLSKAVSSHLASSVSDKLPFIVAQYDQGMLPDKLVFDGSFRNRAFKANTHYAFVVTAFSKKENTNKVKFSMSTASDPPIFIGKDMRNEWIKEHKPSFKRFATTVLYTMVLAVVILTILILLVVGLAYMNQKNREMLYGRISSDEESEIEFFTKPVHGGKKFKKKATKNKKNLQLLEPSLMRQARKENNDPPSSQRPLAKQFFQKHFNYRPLPLENPDLFNETERYQRRVNEIKRMSNQEKDDHEVRPELFSVATPPDSPRGTSRPTSPLIRAHRSNSPDHPPGDHNFTTSPLYIRKTSSPPPQHKPHCMDYMSSPVAACINYEEDLLAASFTLPRSRPYVTPDSVIRSQHYYKTHKPGSMMPKMPDPEPPKPASKREKRFYIRRDHVDKALLMSNDEEKVIPTLLFRAEEEEFVDARSEMH